MRSQRRKLTASPTSHQQSRPKNPQQLMARSVLERMTTQSRPLPRRWTASQMKLQQSRLRPLQQMGRSVLVRMMKQLNLPQRRLIPSLRPLLKPHDNPRFTILFKSMHCQGLYQRRLFGQGSPFPRMFSLIFIMAIWSSLMQNGEAKHILSVGYVGCLCTYAHKS